MLLLLPNPYLYRRSSALRTFDVEAPAEPLDSAPHSNNSKAAASAGDLIKMDGLSSVYYLGGDGKRYVFPNEQTYFSWYQDFSSVKTIPQSELESYPLGANVTIRPGTKLVKITTDPKVYAVEPGGALKHITSETDASNLWGSMWNKRVVDVPDAFFVNYTQTGASKPEGQYPAGTLVKKADSPDVFYFDGTNYRKITSESAFIANRFNWNNIVTAPDSMTITAGGSEITGAESQLTDTSSGAGGTAGAGTGVTVALSGSTAPSGTIIAGQAIANLASFNFTASNDGDVKITGLTFKRTGVSADDTLSAVYLYDGVTRVSDSASVSSGAINFVNTAGIITVPKGTTKTLTVKSNIKTGTSGQTVGVSLNAATDVTTNGAVVSGSFPASGNQMSIAQATLAGFDFASATKLPGDVNPVQVQNDYTMFQENVTVGTRAVDLKSIAFRMIGSVSKTDLQNFRLYVDGVQVGSAVSSLDDNSYVTFDLTSAPKRMETGSRVIKMVGDIKNGSSRNFKFSLRQAADVMVVDTEYNANVLATVDSGTFTAQETGVQTIGTGTMTVTKTSDSPSGNVLQGGSGVTLAKYTMEATGEAIKIDTLRAYFTTGNGALTQLRNGKLKANGVQIGSTASLRDDFGSPAYTEYTVNYTVTPGTPVTLEIIADIYDDDGNNDATSTNVITAYLDAQTGNAQGQSSLQTVNVPDTTDVPGNQLTITTGSVTLSKTATYGDQTVVVPQTTAYKLASFSLAGNSSEDVNINTVSVDFVASGTFDGSDDLYDVYIMYGTEKQTTKTSVTDTGNSWSLTKTLAKNGNVTIEVWGKIRSTVTAGDSNYAKMTVNGTTASSGQTANGGPENGQLLTAGSASISEAKDASSEVSKIVVAGTANQQVAAYKFNAVNDAQTITEVNVDFADATTLVNVKLMDGDTEIQSKPGSTNVTFAGLNILIPANTSKVLKVVAQIGSVGSGSGTSGADITATLDYYKHRPASTGNEATRDVNVAGNALYVYNSKPTITNVALSSTVLAEGNNTIAKFTIAADTNAVYWNRIRFTVSPTGCTVSNYKLYDGSGEVLGTATTSGSDVIFVPTDEQSITGGGEKTYTLKADVTGVGTGDSVSTYIANPSSHASSVAYASVPATATFVWSDGSALGHSTLTADWINDNLVKNLPTDAQGLSK